MLSDYRLDQMRAEAADLLAAVDAEEKRQQGILTVEVIADCLHDAFCTQNHIDGCGWTYENWVIPGVARQGYMYKAERLVKVVGHDGVMLWLDGLEVVQRFR